MEDSLDQCDEQSHRHLIGWDSHNGPLYSHCLFCLSALGSNSSIPNLPVGRRLAFDAAKGRVWVVCAECGRWNLTPLDNRWEVSEECQEAFGRASNQISFGQLSLRRCPDGTELLSLGNVGTSSFGGWKYLLGCSHPEFTKYWVSVNRARRRRRIARVLKMCAAPTLLMATATIFQAYWIALVGVPLLLKSVWKERSHDDRVVARLRDDAGNSVDVTQHELRNARLTASSTGTEVALSIPLGDREVLLRGNDAVWALGLWLPRLNEVGMSRSRARRAIDVVEEVGGPGAFLERVAKASLREARYRKPLRKFPPSVRLAIEIAANGRVEHLVTEGELERLRREWHEAEEIAAISDDMLVPTGVRRVVDAFRKLRQ